MKKATTKGYTRGTTLDEYKAEQMKDPEFKKAWDDLEPEFELLGSMIKVRERKKISQAELAKRLGTKQSAISRLERGAFSKATVETLKKIADALDSTLVIKLQAKKAG
ncbi:MAG TPA: helix-turn-helix transcriptional regulator [Nitrospirota bacterium]|nr:helix-turn-helix transcriptional regulator [Nitrospirota bacterium]